MPLDRDIEAFNDRSARYEQGRLGQMHRDIVSRTLDVAARINESPGRVLDVGCGTGLLLRLLAERSPDTNELVGIDPATGMIARATALADDDRISFSTGVAERLPYPDMHFDVVISTTSFDHWHDQAGGLDECARVLTPGGHLILTDLFSLWLAPTLIGSRHGRARTRRRVQEMLSDAGFSSATWQSRYAVIINTVVASR